MSVAIKPDVGWSTVIRHFTGEEMTVWLSESKYSVEVAREAVRTGDIGWIRAVVANPQADIQILDELSELRWDRVMADPPRGEHLCWDVDCDHEPWRQQATLDIKRRVAVHPRTAASTLEKLAISCDVVILQGVAAHAHTTPAVLRRLAECYCPGVVVQTVLANEHSPVEVFAFAADHRKLLVRHDVASHLRCPPEVLSALAHDPSPTVPERVAANPSTPVEILAELVTSTDPVIRDAVLNNPSTPTHVRVIVVLGS